MTIKLTLKRRKYRRSDPIYAARLHEHHQQALRFQIFHHLEKKYRKKALLYADEIVKRDGELPHEHPKIIWIMWLQGIENAPEIVRMCYQSILDRFSDEYKIVALDQDNVHQYITLPEFIVAKYKKGIISRQWYADLIRFTLLEQYGGTWMDSTIFYGGAEVPKYMLESDLFVYQTMFPATWGIPTVLNSYFITACQNNKIIKLTKQLFYEYWKTHTVCCDYWLVDNFFEMAKNIFNAEWLKVIPEEHITMHILQDRMLKQFDEAIFLNTIQKTPFHKLQWRFADVKFDPSGTYYEYLLTHYPIYKQPSLEGDHVQ